MEEPKEQMYTSSTQMFLSEEDIKIIGGKRYKLIEE